MLFYILNYLLYLHAISQIIHYFSPTTYYQYSNIIKTYCQNTLIVVGFNCIYLYSRGQLFITKVMIEVNAFVEYFNLNVLLDICNGGDGLVDEKIKFISFIKNGLVVNNFFLESVYEKNVLVNKNINFDFDLLAYCTFEDPNYIVLYKSIPDNLEYKLVNYKFIQIELILGAISFNIKLNNPNYDFYVVNNKIDYDFVLYILKIHYSNRIASLSEDILFNYKINIIDQNVNMIDLNRNKILTFKENDYIITGIIVDDPVDNPVDKPIDILTKAQNRKITENMIFSQEDKEIEEYVEVSK